MATEIKTFVEDEAGFITHITVSGETAEDAYTEFQTVLGWFKETGAKPNKGFENKVVRAGGGKPKQEDPVPDDLKAHIPSHCGEPMEYKAAYKNPQTGKDVGAKFQCRKGADCEQASSFNGKKYGFSIWEDRLRKEIEAELAG